MDLGSYLCVSLEISEVHFRSNFWVTRNASTRVTISTLTLGGARKRERERGLTFEDWPRTFYFDRNSRGRIRQEVRSIKLLKFKQKSP